MYFEYGEKELIYLKQKDKRLAEVIDQVGMIERTVDDDLFSSVVHHIVGQHAVYPEESDGVQSRI